jgi:transcriptional regulator with XRE-family HTH domain
MKPTEEQLSALGNYRDIIVQQASKVAEAIGVSPQTLAGWMEGEGEPTSEQAAEILNFLTDSTKKR